MIKRNSKWLISLKLIVNNSLYFGSSLPFFLHLSFPTSLSSFSHSFHCQFCQFRLFIFGFPLLPSTALTIGLIHRCSLSISFISSFFRLLFFLQKPPILPAGCRIGFCHFLLIFHFQPLQSPIPFLFHFCSRHPFLGTKLAQWGPRSAHLCATGHSRQLWWPLKIAKISLFGSKPRGGGGPKGQWATAHFLLSTPLFDSSSQTGNFGAKRRELNEKGGGENHWVGWRMEKQPPPFLNGWNNGNGEGVWLVLFGLPKYGNTLLNIIGEYELLWSLFVNLEMLPKLRWQKC